MFNARRCDNSAALTIVADNYALYALSKYVAPRIRGNFTFLSEMKDYLNGWKAFAVPQGAANDAPAVVYDLYGKPPFSQTYYNATRLQNSTETFDPNNILDIYRKADISHTPFLKNIDTYPSTYSSELARWESKFTLASQDLLINIDATYDRNCFGDTTNSHPEANYFDGYEALDFARTFCEDIVARREEGNDLPSTVRAALWTKNFTRQYTLTKINPGMHLGFAVTGDPASYIESRSADWLFEGPEISANVDHCVLTYKDIISHVRTLLTFKKCDTDSTKRKGGSIKLNDIIYGVHTIPDDRGSSGPWITDYASLGELECADYNITSYWRIASFNEKSRVKSHSLLAPPIAITDADRLSKLCTCWYSEHPFTADMFCKDPAGSCEDLARNDKRVAAVRKGGGRSDPCAPRLPWPGWSEGVDAFLLGFLKYRLAAMLPLGYAGAEPFRYVFYPAKKITQDHTQKDFKHHVLCASKAKEGCH
ncbi:hypothetical protein IG631_23267 [Alternaria alternata]|nr:hypothetical protein IG631_23267 [Alternaria alternata]